MNGILRSRGFRRAFAALGIIAVIAGCSSGGLSPNGSPQMGMPKSTSPGAISVPPMVKTAILPASAMNSPVKPMTDVTGLNWTQITGNATQISAAADGSVWALSSAPSGPDKNIWHYVSGTWTNISGTASAIAVAPNGTLYAVTSTTGVYSYSGGTWTTLGGGATCGHIGRRQ